MLTRFIIDFFHSIVEFILWFSLVAFMVAGYMAFDGLGGALAGLIAWPLFSVFIGGPILLILDIRQRVENIEHAQSKQAPDPSSEEV